MLFSGKLILVANTMPLYTLVQLHIQSDSVMNRENEDQQVITKVLQMINHNIATAKDQQTRVPQPLLFYYRMRNIISVFTSLLNFMICKWFHGKNNLNWPQDETNRNTFIVRRQRRCNFCGNHLD